MRGIGKRGVVVGDVLLLCVFVVGLVLGVEPGDGRDLTRALHEDSLDVFGVEPVFLALRLQDDKLFAHS